jgi:hypothetical protein
VGKTHGLIASVNGSGWGGGGMMCAAAVPSTAI